MGNRRIDHAFLPAGYEPVGIKEHGGIIYLALYNPITGKGQIGSFPSPQKRISEVDGGKLTNTIDLWKDLIQMCSEKTFSDIFNINIEKKNYWFLNKFEKLYQYDDNYPLHIGDKFVLYTNDTDNFNNYKYLVSKIFNTDNNNIVYSPKNRLFNLEVGTLNSENNFVDLTNQLVRWNEKGEFLEPANNSKYNENNGTFIKYI